MITKNRIVRALGLALVASLVPACHDTKTAGAAGGAVVVVTNQAPIFRGLLSAATAGGTTVLLTWEPANDDQDAPSSIRYQVFSAAASGGQNFTAPLLTTAAGATSVSVSGTLGVAAFYVVRAVDSAGLSDMNTGEIAAVPLAAGQLVFVDDSAAGPGTGTFADPFTSLQAGVTAGEALLGGAIILVSAGTYNEAVLLSATSLNPIEVLGGFPNWATFGASQPSAGTMLAARDSAANLTVVDGAGITQFTALGRGLVHVANSSRPTVLSGLRISDAEVVAIFGVDVLLVVSDCSVRDPAAGNTTEVGLKLETSSAVVTNEATLAGNDIREFNAGGTLGRGVGIEFGGATSKVSITSNFIGHSQATTTSTVGISNNTSLFAVAEAESFVVPSSSTSEVRIENNRIFRTNDEGIRLDLQPEAAATAGTLNVLIRGNRIEFIDSDNAIEITDLAFFGDGGTATFLIENNTLTSHSGTGVELDWFETQPVANASDGPTTVTVRNNNISLSDDGYGAAFDLVPPAGGALSYTFENNQCVGIESTAFDIDASGIGALGPADGRTIIVIRNNDVSGASNGDSPDLNVNSPPGAAGLLSVTVEGEFHIAPDSTPDIGIFVDSPLGTDPAGTVYNQTIVVRNNTILDTSGSSSADIEINAMVSNGASSVTVTGNRITTLGDGMDVVLSDQGAIAGPVGSAVVLVSQNDVFSSDNEGILVDVDVTGGGTSVVDILNNRVVASGSAISLEVFSGSSPGGRAYTTIFNNRIDGSDSGQELEYNDQTSATAGEAAFALLLNNTVGTGTESSGTEIRTTDHGLLLFARNAIGPGEVDSDDGLTLFRSGSNPGNLVLRNNVVAYAPGDAVVFSGEIPVQFLNNTVALNGMGGSTSDFGLTSSAAGAFTQPYVKNSIVYLNGGGDLDPIPFIGTSFSLVGDRSPALGFGNITGDPFFLMTADLRELATNFQLRLGSPARNAGDPATADNDPDGSRNDMGAFGGPYAGALGSNLPLVSQAFPTTFPTVPLVVVGLSRPMGLLPTAVAQVDLHGGALLQDFGPANSVNLVFSKPVDAATLAGAVSFSVGGVPVAGIFTASDGGRVATFTPTALVGAGSVVTVTANTGLQAAAPGGALSIPFRTVFGTLPAATAEVEVATPDSNDTGGTAQAIAGTPQVLRVDGTMFDQTDPGDMYSFSATGGQRFQITVAGDRIGTLPGNANFFLEVFDAAGVTVLTSNGNCFGLLGGAGADPYVDFTAPATGTFIVRVSAGMAAGGPYPYQLHWLRQ